MIATCDPGVWIEEQRPDYVRYRRTSDGRRWEAHGTCGYRGDGHGPCMDGGAGPTMDVGPPEDRLDIPVTPELVCDLCVPDHLTFVELASSSRRVIVPTAQGDRCPAAQALRMENLMPEVYDVSRDPLAYGRLLKRLWRDGTGFVVVEHDVVPWPGAITALWDCPLSLCGYCYLLGRAQIGGGLGCVRFGDALLAAHPGAADGWDRVPWNELDGHVYATLRPFGLDDFHVHLPAVGHAPVYADD